MNLKISRLCFYFILLCSIINYSCNNEKKPSGVGILMASFEIERWEKDLNYMIDKLNDQNINIYVEVANNDYRKQFEQAKKLIATKKISVLIIIPVHSDSASAIVFYAHDRGIKTIAYDRIITGCPLDFYVSFDNKKIGNLQVQSILNYEPKGFYLLINGPISDNNSKLLRQGQLEILYRQIENQNINLLVDTYLENWSEESSFNYFNYTLDNQNLKFNAVVCGNDAIARAVIRSANFHGIKDHFSVVGQDADILSLKSIIDGRQTLTIYKPIKRLAYEAANLSIDLIKQPEALQTKRFTSFDNGYYKINSVLLDVYPINRKNMFDILVTDGYLDINQLDLLFR